MKKFKFQLDTDSINHENEQHSNNFHLKVQNLAEHCINFITGSHNSNDCNDRRYDREIHDQNIIKLPFGLGNNNENKICSEKCISHKFIFPEFEFNKIGEKVLL